MILFYFCCFLFKYQLGGLVYNVIIEVQMARYLQQISDPNIAVSCHLPDNKMILHSPALQLEKQNSRYSKKHWSGWSPLYFIWYARGII